MTRRKALVIVGIILVLFGLLAIGAVVAVAARRGGYVPTDLVLVLIGVAFVGGSVWILITQRKGMAEEERLREYGLAYDGQVTSIERTVRSALTGSAYYTLTAYGERVAASGEQGAKKPGAGRLGSGKSGSGRSAKKDRRTFTKNFSSVKPFHDVGDDVTIYVDPDDPERFYVAGA